MDVSNDNDNLLVPLDFEEVEPTEPYEEDGRPPVKARATYQPLWPDTPPMGLSMQPDIVFELRYDDSVPPEYVEQLKEELRVLCEILPADDGSSREQVAQNPPHRDEDSETTNASPTEDDLDKIIFIELSWEDTRGQEDSMPFTLNIEIDPSIDANFSHWYSVTNQVATVNINVTSNAGAVQATLTFGGTQDASVGAPASLSTGVSSPDLKIRGLQNGSRYRVSGSMAAF